MKIAVLLTTYNRKSKTLLCLRSLSNAKLPEGISYDIYLTDDNSNDGTVDDIKLFFPDVDIEVSEGDLYWARGMNKSWSRAIEKNIYDGFLLLNDDVTLFENFWSEIFDTHDFCLERKKKHGIYVSSTLDPISGLTTYGGNLLKFRFIKFRLERILPEKIPIECDVANANILFIDNSVVEKIGIFDKKYIHGIADYDYSIAAVKANFPIFVTPNFGGFCINDHVTYSATYNKQLKERLKFLYDPKGLAYKEYCYYLKKNFLFQYPYYFFMIWMKIIFPFLWHKK